MQKVEKYYNLDGNIETMSSAEWEHEVSKVVHERLGAPSGSPLIPPDILDMYSLGTTVREGVHAYKTLMLIWSGNVK